MHRRGIWGRIGFCAAMLAAAMLLLAACGGGAAGAAGPGGQAGDAEYANRLEAILGRGYMEVVMEPAFAPNQFMDPSKPPDEQVVGSDVEFAKYIAEKLGVECRIIPLEFGAVLAGVSEGKYDMAISSIAYTPGRDEAMSLSKGYFFSTENRGHGLLVHNDLKDTVKGPEDVKGRSVVAQSGSLQELFVNEQLEGYSEFQRVSSTNDMFLSVQERKAEVGVTSITTAELFIAANPDCGLHIVEGFSFYQDESTLGTRIGMPPGEDELLAKINEIIDEVLESGVYIEWYDEYTEYAKNIGVE